jgi:large subunit ribosomal protein L4
MNVKIFSKEGQDTGREINLSDEVFNIESNNHVLYLAVKQYQANQRQGTHKSKERWEISRTTKKAFRQKGTGGARRGDMKSPLVRGGGRVFGPKPHSYDFKLNKKVKDLAKKSALSTKAKNGSLIVIEDFSFEAPKTKDFAKILTGLQLTGVKSTFIFGDVTPNLWKSSRNIDTALVVAAAQMNVLDIMDNKKLIISEQAVKAIEAAFSNN